MVAIRDYRRAQWTLPRPPLRGRSATGVFAVVALLSLFPGCASSPEPSVADAPLTVERILTEPLAGVAGISSLKQELSKAYGIAPSADKYINRDPRPLSDGWILSQLWIEPSPADFISITLPSEPCYPAQRALDLTQATPYAGSGELSAPLHNAFRNGVLVGLTLTANGKCLRTIHIEKDK